MTEKQRVHGVASRAFASFKADGAEEFETIAALAERLAALKKIQEDVPCDLWDAKPKITVETGKRGDPWGLSVALKTERHGVCPFTFRESAFDQFCSTIGFPSDTLTRCPLELAQQNLAHFSMLSSEKKLLFRTEGDDVRAVLSGGYREVDHLEVTEAFLKSKFRYSVNYAGLTPRKMFLLAIEDTDKFEGPDGSIMRHGTYVGNSETGDGSFFAADFFYDYICQNRNIWGYKVRGGEYRRIHRGDVREGLKLLMEWIGTDRRVQIQQAQAIMKKASEDKWGRDDAKVVEYLTEKGIQKRVAQAALALAQDRWPGMEYTRYKVYSGVTAAAQAYPQDKRFEIEQAAGALLTA